MDVHTFSALCPAYPVYLSGLSLKSTTTAVSSSLILVGCCCSEDSSKKNGTEEAVQLSDTCESTMGTTRSSTCIVCCPPQSSSSSSSTTPLLSAVIGIQSTASAHAGGDSHSQTPQSLNMHIGSSSHNSQSLHKSILKCAKKGVETIRCKSGWTLSMLARSMVAKEQQQSDTSPCRSNVAAMEDGGDDNGGMLLLLMMALSQVHCSVELSVILN
mmetsp:Transcript_17516/g.31665  ORF Transcript_17516/g.31665 Transcript_17516/m.31665 type:complete len:214 (-) Transcript_17516:148-789(-)